MLVVGVIEASKENKMTNAFQRVLNCSNIPYTYVENYNENISEEKKIKIIKIRPDAKENLNIYKNRFDIVVYNNSKFINDESNEDIYFLHNFFTSLGKQNITIINIDNDLVPIILQNSKMNLITYGLKSKATVTASSIETGLDNSIFVLCIQRNVIIGNKKILTPQEFPIKVSSGSIENIYRVIPIILTLLINGKKISEVTKIIY